MSKKRVIYNDDTVETIVSQLTGYAHNRGGICFATELNSVDYHTDVEWECAEGHRWHAPPTIMVHNEWCPHCKDRPVVKKKNDFMENLLRRLDAVESRNSILLQRSEKMENHIDELASIVVRMEERRQ